MTVWPQEGIFCQERHSQGYRASIVRGGVIGTTRTPRGSRRSVSTSIAPPFPAAAQPSKTIIAGICPGTPRVPGRKGASGAGRGGECTPPRRPQVQIEFLEHGAEM